MLFKKCVNVTPLYLSEDEVRKDNISEDESDEDFVPDEPTSEIEDNIDTIANSSTDDESGKVRVD